MLTHMKFKDDRALKRPEVTTPATITPAIREFAHELTGNQPLYLAVRPEPFSLATRCFPNVSQKIKFDGGDIAFGWIIWEWPNAYLDAEFHGVWKSPAGELVDVTPYQDGETRILFVPDSVRRFENVMRPNRHRALTSNPAVHCWIEAARKYQAYCASHTLPDCHTEMDTRMMRLSNKLFGAFVEMNRALTGGTDLSK